MVPPTTSPTVSVVRGARSRIVPAVAAKMANPPSSATGRRDHRSAFGRSMNPHRRAPARTSGVSAREAARATAKVSTARSAATAAAAPPEPS